MANLQIIVYHGETGKKIGELGFPNRAHKADVFAVSIIVQLFEYHMTPRAAK